MEMGKTPKHMISVIIPAYNAESTIQACLHALNCQTGIDRSNYEIIVVDDHSTDNTAVICEQDESICLIKLRGHDGPKGASTARNKGLRAAQGNIICFTDADCEPTPDWLCNLIQPFSDPEIAGCKGIYATKQTELIARFIQIEYEDKYDRLRKQERIDFIDTYSAGYLREVLLDNDGFDELFHYAEDVELSFRLATRGYQFVFQPNAVVYHNHPNTFRSFLNKKFWNGYWRTQTVRRFPERAVKDSHTPQVLKIQIMLMALWLGVTAILPVTAVFAPTLLSYVTLIWLIVMFIFLLTSFPFVRKAWHKDKVVALVSPIILAIRSLALGFGTAVGIFRPNKDIFGKK